MTRETSRGGRPRSSQAQEAILHAVDDLLVEEGYAAMTMKSIATRAGVSRQTLYRWWSTKAEILFEACVIDAEQELTIPPQPTPLADLTAFISALVTFLAHSHAGAAYRALMGETQHDPAVAELLAQRDVLSESARAVIHRVIDPMTAAASVELAIALLVGPTYYWIISGRDPGLLDPEDLARDGLRRLRADARSSI